MPYYQHFGLDRDPFLDTADPHFYRSTGNLAHAKNRLVQSIERLDLHPHAMLAIAFEWTRDPEYRDLLAIGRTLVRVGSLTVAATRRVTTPTH